MIRTCSRLVWPAMVAASLAVPTGAHADSFVPHKNVPGPSRLDMEKADNSGAVNTNPQFIADRQAIINHVTAYSYLIDEGRWDEWFALFSDDIAFENTTPELGTVLIEGKKPFMAMVDERYIKPGKTSKGVRRHTMGNVHVASQTATTAKVRTYMFISSVPAADKLQILTSGTYNANLEKRDGKWTITRWYIEADAPLSPSKMPEGFSEAELKWFPILPLCSPARLPDLQRGWFRSRIWKPPSAYRRVGQCIRRLRSGRGKTPTLSSWII